VAFRPFLEFFAFWLKDESLEDSDNLPEPEILAAEIVENLEAALEQFRSIYEELGKDQTLELKAE
jgi:type I restriction enzyme M protein